MYIPRQNGQSVIVKQPWTGQKPSTALSTHTYIHTHCDCACLYLQVLPLLRSPANLQVQPVVQLFFLQPCVWIVSSTNNSLHRPRLEVIRLHLSRISCPDALLSCNLPITSEESTPFIQRYPLVYMTQNRRQSRSLINPGVNAQLLPKQNPSAFANWFFSDKS